MRVDPSAAVRLCIGLVGLFVALGCATPAHARYRYPPRLPFDHRPALSQKAVGAMSLSVLADAAAATEAAEVCPLPLIGCPVPVVVYPPPSVLDPPPGYSVFP